jgi:hypothetical protein
VYSKSEIRSLQEEMLSSLRDRYEWINARREEMGMRKEDVDELVNDHRKSFAKCWGWLD